MHPFIDRAAEHKLQAVSGNRPFFRNDVAIGQKYPRGVVIEIAAIEQFPRFAVGAQAPVAEQARVAEVQPLLRGRGNLAIRLGDEDGVPLVSDDVRRPHGEFEHRTSASLQYLCLGGNTMAKFKCSRKWQLDRSLTADCQVRTLTTSR